MGFARRVFLSLCFVSALAASTSTAQAFNCSSSGACTSLIDYVSPNTTTLSAIQTLFGIESLRSILGSNNFPLSNPSNLTVSAKQTIKIPFPCKCANGTGKSNQLPVYKVVADDGLYHIAAEVFSGLVTFEEIQEANNISDANMISVGQELWIPLPCSCDEVDGERVVHYGHVVRNGSTVEGIAQEFNTTEDTLLTLNGLASPKDLMAGAVLDVPLKACRSMVSTNSLDYPLLVPNGTYVFTAADCVMCNCEAANNFTLQCMPSQNYSQSCPSMQCQGAGGNLYLGNTTSASSCSSTTCAYAGYTNRTILTTLALDSTCSVPDNGAPKFSLQGWRWNFLLIFVHLILPCLHLFYEGVC